MNKYIKKTISMLRSQITEWESRRPRDKKSVDLTMYDNWFHYLEAVANRRKLIKKRVNENNEMISRLKTAVISDVDANDIMDPESICILADRYHCIDIENRVNHCSEHFRLV